MIKKQKNLKFEFTNEKLTYFTKFTIQHVVYVIKQMFTNESLFTIQQLLFGDSTVLYNISSHPHNDQNCNLLSKKYESLFLCQIHTIQFCL